MSSKRKRSRPRREVLPAGIVRRGGLLVADVPSPVAIGKSAPASSALLDVSNWKRQAELAESGLREAVAAARRRGASWAEVAAALGVSSQAAHRKYRSEDA